MVTYRVHQKQISDRLQVQFIYENSPVFAGTDELSLLVRFKYTGDISSINLGVPLHDPFTGANSLREANSDRVQVHTSTSIEEQKAEAPKDNDSGGWFGSRLSSQLSNATRSLFLQNLNSLTEEDEDSNGLTGNTKAQEEKKLTLFLGYAQILGHYLINDTIIDYSIFKDLEKSTIIEGKYAGIQGLDAVSHESAHSGGLLSGLSATYNTEMNSSVDSKMVEKMKFIPFYSTNQNIIFSELVFDPETWTASSQHTESVKSFYINCQLPKDLPPTYCTEAVQINYNFILGYQMMEGNNIVSKSVFVPLKIQPFIDNCGRQPVYHLNKARLNTYMEDLTAEDVSNHLSFIKSDSFSQSGNILLNGQVTQNQPSRRISFWNLKKKLKRSKSRSSSISTVGSSLEKRRLSSVTSISNSEEPDEKITEFLDILDSLDQADVNNIIQVQEQFEKKMNETKFFKFNVRENLMQIMADYKYVQRQKLSKKDFDDHLEYDYLLPKEQQTKYIIKQNHGIISTLFLNKGIFKLGDLVNLNISFAECKYKTKGIEVQLLKHQIFHREEYLKKGNYDEVSSRLDKNILETILYEKVISAFDATSINMDVLIPVETEPQFKTNFFISKYYLQVRFIIIDSMEKARNAEEVTNQTAGNETINVEAADAEVKKINCDLRNIFIDTTGSMLFRAKDHLSNANEFYIRIPLVVLPTYEQDFGIVTTKV
ncbi:hypothetical protein PMKS-002051 [Pichia membranifaciens]|uniref:Uncharacterized protein n=1 Tax=Pichia membranifaciens TaxID=4926 RepID=A0A1Q2YG87_9ASCO|nr:hypothetical protein PMKS-002051 [Pichia membranifaciens]